MVGLPLPYRNNTFKLNNLKFGMNLKNGICEEQSRFLPHFGPVEDFFFSQSGVKNLHLVNSLYVCERFISIVPPRN